MPEQPTRLTDLPDDELRKTLENMYPEEMGVTDAPVVVPRLKRISSRKGQFTHEELRQSYGNRKQLESEHPEYLGIEATRSHSGRKPRQKLSINFIKELMAGQLLIPDINRGVIPAQNPQYAFPDIMPGVRTARVALQEGRAKASDKIVNIINRIKA